MARDKDAEAQAIRDRFPHIAAWALPSPPVFSQYEAWVLWGDGADDEGNLLGHCPLHDKQREVEASAEFNFRKGVMRCQGDPRCDPRKRSAENNGRVPRSMSLVNLSAAMSNGD